MSHDCRLIRYDDAAKLLDRLAELPADSIPTGFQHPDWLRQTYDKLAPAHHARAAGIEIRDKASGELAILVPLVIFRENGLMIAELPDFGVSDYKSAILGPAAPSTAEDSKALMKSIVSELSDVDLLRLDSILEDCAGRPNPLFLAGHTLLSRHRGNRLTIPGTYEEYLRSRGKKYRTDVERCFRHLEKAGDVAFKRATTTAEKIAAFDILEERQLIRRQELSGDYILDQPQYSMFHRALLTSEDALAQLFSLSVSGEVIATLFALEHCGTATVLRFATGDKRWSNTAPGRLILMSMIRHYLSIGVRTFDFGIGEYPFKDGFGFEPYPLYDRLLPISWRAYPVVALAAAKAHLHHYPRIVALADRFRGKG